MSDSAPNLGQNDIVEKPKGIETKRENTFLVRIFTEKTDVRRFLNPGSSAKAKNICEIWAINDLKLREFFRKNRKKTRQMYFY